MSARIAQFVIVTAFLLFGVKAAVGQTTSWLTDDQAREVAAASIHSVYPQPCYSTYRNESLEDAVMNLRRNPLVGNRFNNSVYIYRVASDVCYYIVEKEGKSIPMAQVSSDCCEYGLVAVDRITSKSYWFHGEQRADIFKEFAQDEQLHPDSPEPSRFISLYRDLVWGESSANEISGLGQLRDAVEQNFQSAYSPYERDNLWQRKFDGWWRKFLSHNPKLKLETTYERKNDETIVRGYAFKGFSLTIPRSDPPPKGMPTLFEWAILIKSDGTVEKLPSRTIYSAR